MQNILCFVLIVFIIHIYFLYKRIKIYRWFTSSCCRCYYLSITHFRHRNICAFYVFEFNIPHKQPDIFQFEVWISNFTFLYQNSRSKWFVWLEYKTITKIYTKAYDVSQFSVAQKYLFRLGQNHLRKQWRTVLSLKQTRYFMHALELTFIASKRTMLFRTIFTLSIYASCCSRNQHYTPKSIINKMKSFVSIIQTMIRIFLLIGLLFHGSTKDLVFATALPSEPSEAELTNLAIEKLNPCERAVWR